MKAERRGNEFVLRMNVTELTTLFCIVAEEKISQDIDAFRFNRPDKIKQILSDFHLKVFNLMETRTPEEKEQQSQNFFKKPSSK